MIKRVVSAVLIFTMLMGLLSACENNAQPEQDDKISIVCTTFAAYDWTKAVAGNNIDGFSVYLLGNGVDLHSFQPTASDIAKIHTADLVVSMGGFSEKWMGDLNLGDKELVLFDLLGETERLCAGEEHHEHNHSDEQYDEHIWLSLRLAQRMVLAICEKICDLDSANGVGYQKNCAEYVEELKALDAEYKSALIDSNDKTVIFADRYPFAYMMTDYGINCISAFEGCSSETNASFDTIARLTEEIKKYNKNTVLILENSAQSVAHPLRNALGDIALETAVMNSCQVVERADEMSYTDIMIQNLKSLKKALR